MVDYHVIVLLCISVYQCLPSLLCTIFNVSVIFGCSVSNTLLNQLDALLPSGTQGQQRRRMGMYSHLLDKIFPMKHNCLLKLLLVFFGNSYLDELLPQPFVLSCYIIVVIDKYGEDNRNFTIYRSHKRVE